MSERESRHRLRATFDGDAERYLRARPGYPAAVFDDLADLARLAPGSRVLELGPGTGKATLPLAERGYRVTAVELGEHLAAVARRELAPFPDVRIDVAPFEAWPLPDEPFDAVVAATAFAWIDPAVRVRKSAEALRPGGTLATIGTDHVLGGTVPFFAEVQRCYERHVPGTPAGMTLPRAEDIPQDGEEIERAGRFETPVFRRYAWDAEYSTAAYLDVLQTYSGHRDLDPSARDRLLDCIATLIERRYGGRIVKRYLTTLRTARLRRPPQPYA